MAPDLPAGLMWRKSSLSSDNGTCVEIADLSGELVAVRDSKHPASHLVVPRDSLLNAATQRY